MCTLRFNAAPKRWTTATARGAGMARIELEVFTSNEGAIALYKALGCMMKGVKQRARRREVSLGASVERGAAEIQQMPERPAQGLV